MVRHGKNVKENEGVMAIIILYPIILWLFSTFYRFMGWGVKNYLGNQVPYSLGTGLFLAVLYFSAVVDGIFLLYLTTLFVTGFIDDRFGTKYPKGIKGHIGLFIKTGKITTGFIKLVSTVLIGLFGMALLGDTFLDKIAILFLLVLPPHVMNLFDTRPLRVWKVISIHLVLLFSFVTNLSIQTILVILFLAFCLIYFEGTKLAMLGDNGATLLGGVLSVVAISNLSVLSQWLLITLYSLVVIVTEKISISEWIEKIPLLRKIDRWGVS